MWNFRRGPTQPVSPPPVIVVDSGDVGVTSPLRTSGLPPRSPVSPPERSAFRGIRPFLGNAEDRETGNSPTALHEDATPLRQNKREQGIINRSPPKTITNEILPSPKQIVKPKMRTSSRCRTAPMSQENETVELEEGNNGTKKVLKEVLYPKETADIVLLTETEQDLHEKGGQSPGGNSHGINPATASPISQCPSTPHTRQQYGNLLQEWASTSAQLKIEEETQIRTDCAGLTTSPLSPKKTSSEAIAARESRQALPSESSSKASTPRTETRSQDGERHEGVAPKESRKKKSSSSKRRKSNKTRQPKRHYKQRHQNIPDDDDDEDPATEATFGDEDGVMALLDVAIDWTWDFFTGSKADSSIKTMSSSLMKTVGMPRSMSYATPAQQYITDDELRHIGGTTLKRQARSMPLSKGSGIAPLENTEAFELDPRPVDRTHDTDDKSKNQKYQFFNDASASWNDDDDDDDEEESIAFITTLSFGDNEEEQKETSESLEPASPKPSSTLPLPQPSLDLPSLAATDAISTTSKLAESDPQAYALTRITSALSVASSKMVKKEPKVKESKEWKIPEDPKTSQIIYSPFPSGRLPLVTPKAIKQPDDLDSTDAIRDEGRRSSRHDTIHDVVGMPLPSLLDQSSRTRSFLDRYFQKGDEALPQSLSTEEEEIHFEDKSILDAVDTENDEETILAVPPSATFDFSRAAETFMSDTATEITNDFDDYGIAHLKSQGTDLTDYRQEETDIDDDDDEDEYAIELFDFCRTEFDDSEEARAMARTSQPWNLCAVATLWSYFN